MSFLDIKGQAIAVRLIKNAIEKDKLASTYLFYGSDGIGKELTAWTFAKALNCEKNTGSPCDVCSACRRIEKREHPDVIYLCPIGASRSIKIEQVRDMQKALSWKAYEAKKKVVIIKDADTLTQEAGNALLKTLEEPPQDSVIVMISHKPEAVLETIRSRAQDVQFFDLPSDIAAGILAEKGGFNRQEAEFYGKLGMGSIGKALELSNESVYNRRKIILDALAKGSFDNTGELTAKIEEMIEDLQNYKEELYARFKDNQENESQTEDKEAFVAGEYRRQEQEIFNLILTWYRDILIFKVNGNTGNIINVDYIDTIKDWNNKLSIDSIEEKTDVIDGIKSALARNINLKLLFQVMFIKLGFI